MSEKTDNDDTSVSYEEVRGLIKTGDFIGETGASIFSWLIRTYNMSEISHIGMAQTETFRGHKRVNMIESLEPHGVSSRALSSLDYFWWLPIKLTQKQRLDIDARHHKLKGNVRYSKRGIVLQILRGLPGVGDLVKNSWLDPDRTICSRYVTLHMQHYYPDVPQMPNPRDMAKWGLLHALDKRRSLGPVLVMCPKKEPLEF